MPESKTDQRVLDGVRAAAMGGLRDTFRCAMKTPAALLLVALGACEKPASAPNPAVDSAIAPATTSPSGTAERAPEALSTSATAVPSSSAGPVASSSATAVATGSSAAGPLPSGCKGNDAAQRACGARGAGFEYGPAPFIYCSGVAPQSGFGGPAATTSATCVCNDLAAIAQRRMECARMPSAPPRR